CCAILTGGSHTVDDRGKDITMAPPPGRLGGAVKLPVQVRMFPEEIAAVDAFAAALSQQSYGAAFSRAEALRIAAMEWLKERQASRTGGPPAAPRGRSPVRCMAWCSGGRSAKCTTAMWRRGRSARRCTEAPRRAGAGSRPPGRLCSALIPSSHLWTNSPQLALIITNGVS